MNAPPASIGYLDPDSVVVLTHPDAIKHVLYDNHANYIKGAAYDDLRSFLGQGMLTSDGDAWVTARKRVQPAFHAVALEAYHRAMVEITAAFLQEWKSRSKPGRAVDISAELSRLSLRIVAKTLLRIDLAHKEDAILRSLREILDPGRGGALLRRVYRFLPVLARARDRRALSNFAHAVSWIIENRSGEPDLISCMAAGSPEATGASASSRMRDEIATFLLAGQETSALGLTWTLHLLSRHPDAERKIRAEIVEVLNHRSPSAADLPRLTYTGMVIKETMRLYPPVPAFVRQAVQDDVIAGFKIRANAIVRIKTAIVHRHPDFWPKPEQFSPERFAPYQAATQKPCTYLPFGAGARSCIGSNFAMMEMKSALAMILQAARLRSAQEQPVETLSRITLRPRYGLWMIPEFASGRQ